MLGKILPKEACGRCGFCCVFRRQSLWETPLFSPREKTLLRKKYPSAEFKRLPEGCFTISLDARYGTDDPDEEAACCFLEEGSGCVLGPDEKPFDCAVWPLRLMRRDGLLLIALTPTCPAVGPIPTAELKAFVREGLAEKIFRAGADFPYVTKSYRDGFPVVLTESEFRSP